MNRPFIAFIALIAIAGCATDVAAMYNPRLGRFMQRDGANPSTGLIHSRTHSGPVSAYRVRDARTQYADGASLYQYVRSNPVAYADPTGNRALRLELLGEPGSTTRSTLNEIPGVGAKDQLSPGAPLANSEDPHFNCGGTAFCQRQAWIEWPHVGSSNIEGDWNAALAFVPRGCKRVACDGVSFGATRCNKGDREIIAFLWRYPFQVHEGYTVAFHAIGRTIGEAPPTWSSKRGEGAKWTGIEDPDAHLEAIYQVPSGYLNREPLFDGDDYPARLKKEFKLEKLCFCCDCKSIETKPKALQ